MSDVAAPLPLALPSNSRWPALAAAAALAFAAGLMAWRLSPSPGPALALAFVAGAAALGLAGLSGAAEAGLWAKVFAAAACVCGLVAAAPEASRFGVGFLSLALLAGGAYKARGELKLTLPRLGLAVALVAALDAFNAYYVIVSKDLMIADFMFYRVVSIAAGTLVREGRLLALAVDLAGSMPKDYSWLPALAPGFALAAFGLLSRAVYQGAIVLFYAAPALLALAWAAREIAGVRARGAFVFALVAVAAAYPFGLVVASRGMPDIGGLALFVVALRLAAKLAQTLALPPGHDIRVAALARKLGFALALTLFGMFLFRRWYAFAAVALMASMALEIAAVALRRGADFRWREAALAACVGALTLLALLAPVLIDWLPNPAAHDYARMYAAYRKTPAVLAQVVGDWCGYAPLALALAGGLWLAVRSRSRFARLAFVSGPLAAALFLRVQSPYPHHLYLIAPFVMLFVAAPLLVVFAKSRAVGVAALAALAALTMTPAGALLPSGLFPASATPHAPRADLDELVRLKDWVDVHATPSHKVCGLGSSYTFSGQLIYELWQVKPGRSPLGGPDVSVGMTDVDTVDGPPTPKMKDCAVTIVGDPVQTHVIPSYQLTVTLPSQEMLDGTGIGANYRRTGEVFMLEKGVKAVVFERTSPLGEADMAALAERWREARRQVERAQQN